MANTHAAPLGAIRSASKGRVIEATAKNGFIAPTKCVLPIGNLVLPSGRVLLYAGITKQQMGTHFDLLSCWKTEDQLGVIASVDQDHEFGRILHVSVSYSDKYPTWEEMLEVRYTFYPRTIDVMMIMPKDGSYVNLHEYCFQLRECPTQWSGR